MRSFLKVLVLGCGLCIFATNLQAADTGFAIGKDLTAVDLVGSVSAWCPDMNSNMHYQTYYCHDEALLPDSWSQFVTQTSYDADQIQLQSTQQDGTARTQSSAYDPTKSSSTKHFNLWVWTLLQRPLLAYGKNSIQYTLSKSGTEVTKGQLQVEVKNGGTKNCPHVSYGYVSSIECDASGASLCSRYFHETCH